MNRRPNDKSLKYNSDCMHVSEIEVTKAEGNISGPKEIF